MKKLTFLFSLLFFTISLFSQIVKTDVVITGLGNFQLNDDIAQTTDNVEANATRETNIYRLANDVISCTNIPFVNYLFDYCSLSFNKHSLSLITYTKVFDKKNKGLTEFSYILSILERDYGKQPDKSAILQRNEDEMRFIWADEKDGLITLLRYYDKERIEYKVVVIAQRIKGIVDGNR